MLSTGFSKFWISPSEGRRFPECHVALHQYHHLGFGSYPLGQGALSVLHQGWRVIFALYSVIMFNSAACSRQLSSSLYRGGLAIGGAGGLAVSP